MKENLEKLKVLSIEYDSNISKEESSLTKEVLEKEKNLYLKRRMISNIDFC